MAKPKLDVVVLEEEEPEPEPEPIPVAVKAPSPADETIEQRAARFGFVILPWGEWVDKIYADAPHLGPLEPRFDVRYKPGDDPVGEARRKRILDAVAEENKKPIRMPADIKKADLDAKALAASLARVEDMEPAAAQADLESKKWPRASTATAKDSSTPMAEMDLFGHAIASAPAKPRGRPRRAV